eukprot:scaffold81805_cov50-Attheya_sp.AAC.2
MFGDETDHNASGGIGANGNPRPQGPSVEQSLGQNACPIRTPQQGCDQHQDGCHTQLHIEQIDIALGTLRPLGPHLQIPLRQSPRQTRQETRQQNGQHSMRHMPRQSHSTCTTTRTTQNEVGGTGPKAGQPMEGKECGEGRGGDEAFHDEGGHQ